MVNATYHYSDDDPEHWEQLYEALPKQGVMRHFTSEEECLKRLINVRWPSGIHCSACGSTDIGNIETRKPYQCKKCRHQFTPTSGTICHGARIGLIDWFVVAEMIISANRSKRPHELQTSERLRKRIGVTYKVAFALRAKLQADHIQPGGGLIGHGICINESRD